MNLPLAAYVFLHEGHEHSNEAGGSEWVVIAVAAVVVLVLVAYGLKQRTR